MPPPENDNPITVSPKSEAFCGPKSANLGAEIVGWLPGWLKLPDAQPATRAQARPGPVSRLNHPIKGEPFLHDGNRARHIPKVFNPTKNA